MDKFDGHKYYHKIPGLLIPRLNTYEQVHKSLDSFIDQVPTLAASLETNFLAIGNSHQEHSKFLENIGFLKNLLKDIYAKNLASEADRLELYTKQGNKKDLIKKIFKPFITDVVSLSVAIQKAQGAKDTNAKIGSFSKIEILSSVVKTLTEILCLLEDNAHEKAVQMTRDLIEFNKVEQAIEQVLAHLIKQEYKKGQQLIEVLIEEYAKEFDNLAGVDLSKKILAVDDMPEILSFVNNALKNRYKVIAVPSGKAALKAMEMHKLDLFILDIDMPEMNGLELAEKIRAMDSYKDTPLIFLTGNSTREHITKAMAIGCDDFIVKPASHEYLLTKVGKFLV